MINVSNKFKDKLQDGEPVTEVVDITFADGRKVTLNEEILLGGGDFSDGAGSSSFPIGATVCKSMTLSLDNTEDQWKDYYFYQAKVTAYLKMQLDDSVETIKKGTYTITTPEQYGEVLEFTALDDMYKANATYTSKLPLPQSAFTLLRDACADIGISMGFSEMEHGDVIINSIPDRMTFRQLIGWVAMLDSANARVDNDGNLQLIKWNFDAVSVDYAATVDSEGYLEFGGGASVDSDEYVSPNGGNWYLDSDGYLTLREGVGSPQRFRDYVSFPTLSSDDIVITGIKLKNSENELLYGKEGYVLELENDLIETTDLGTVAAWIGDNLIGRAFRSLEGDLAYNPLSEFGDMAFTYDRNDNKYITPLTDVASSLNGVTSVKTQAEDPVRGSSKFLSSAEKTLIAAKKLIKNEKDERQQAIEKLQNALDTAGGLFETNEILDDGSTISYLHDKPLLAESKVIIKVTNNAIGVSNDGGKTYPYGFILDGTTITRLLYAEGINADYVNSGCFTVKDIYGNIIFQADMDLKKVYMNGSSVQIGGGKTIDDIQKDAENAMNAAALARNMTLQLSNEYQGISVDSDGKYGTFPSGITTSPVVMYGTQDITEECRYTISESSGITGTWDASKKIYTVTELSADSGWVDIKATYLSTLSVVKRLSVVKQYAGKTGPQGEKGVPGRTYFIRSNANVLLIGQDKKTKLGTLNVNAYYRDGQGEEKSFSGYWVREYYSPVLGMWARLLKTGLSASTEFKLSEYNWYANSLVRITCYLDEACTQIADQQTYQFAVDVDALTHEEIFNLLTNNGSIKGIYKEGNQLYISFTYAKGGTLKLGGPNNGYGTFEVYDANGSLICKVNNTDGFKNVKGNEWIQMLESIITAGYGNHTDGLLDLSAQYGDGTYNVVLEAKTGSLILKTPARLRVETTSGSSLFMNFGAMPNLTSGSHLGKNSSGDVGTISSSSMRYKVLGKTVKEEELEEFYRIKVIWAKYKDGYLMEADERCGKEMPMFLAEDIERRFPIAVDHDEKGRAEDWNYRIMIPCMFAMIKNEHEKVKELQSEIESLKAQLKEIRSFINNIKKEGD